MPNTPESTLNVVSRLPGFLRKRSKQDIAIRNHNRANVYNGRVDRALAAGLYRNYSYWQSVVSRYRDIMTGSRTFRPLRVPISDRLLALVSRESRIPIPVLRDPTTRHAPNSDVSKARMLFILLMVRVGNSAKTHAALPLNLSPSYGSRACGVGAQWLITDTAFATRYNLLLRDCGGFSLSNLIPQ